MASAFSWTSSDLELLPDDGKRYEIIEGELFVSEHPHWYHQIVCGRACMLLDEWSRQTKRGQANIAPGLIFSDTDDVAPDVVWNSHERLQKSLGEDGKLHLAPELAIEVLSPGSTNERCDRDAKLKLYSRRGVQEYWILDWRARDGSLPQRRRCVATCSDALRERYFTITAAQRF